MHLVPVNLVLTTPRKGRASSVPCHSSVSIKMDSGAAHDSPGRPRLGAVALLRGPPVARPTSDKLGCGKVYARAESITPH